MGWCLLGSAEIATLWLGLHRQVRSSTWRPIVGALVGLGTMRRNKRGEEEVGDGDRQTAWDGLGYDRRARRVRRHDGRASYLSSSSCVFEASHRIATGFALLCSAKCVRIVAMEISVSDDESNEVIAKVSLARVDDP
jgi:hypothetical protein